ncbi:MAG TPA: hypothetical protein VG077_16795 [Verrucomicrobiae bacterium]|nr:hypothetical protein [Verrucomicrobiae bacterium]
MRAILDAGPLVTLWNQEGKRLAWARNIFERFSGPYYVTEPILAEVAHLTGKDKLIVEGLRAGKFLLPQTLMDQLDDIDRCLDQFDHCDLADASLVALSEQYRRLSILTEDRRHFVTYRRADGSALPLELPEG